MAGHKSVALVLAFSEIYSKQCIDTFFHTIQLLEVCAISSVLLVIIERGASCDKVTAHARD